MTYYVPSTPVRLELGGERYTPAGDARFNFQNAVEPPAENVGITVRISAGWRRARLHQVRLSDLWAQVAAKEIACRVQWGRAGRQDVFAHAAWDTVAAKDVVSLAEWGQAVGLDRQAAAGWGIVPAKDAWRWLDWRARVPARDVRFRLIYRPRVPARDSRRRAGWFRCDEFGPRRDLEAERRATLYTPLAELVAFTFSGKLYSPATSEAVFFDFRNTPPNYAIQPVDRRSRSGFGTARVLEQLRLVPWGWGIPTDAKPTGIVYPDYPGPVVVIDPPVEPELLETYMIANTVTLTVLPSGTALDATQIRIGLDIDSFAWTFSAELFGRTSLNLVKPDGNGPKTVELNINGWVWRFLVERWSGNAQHPAERYTISGASRTQLLSDPYAPKRSGMNTAPLNARQVVDEQLFNTGFSATWDTVNMGPPDWTLPAGAFSYQDQTPMQVIHRLAEVVGGVVRPDLSGDAMAVVPRYREAVWSWSSAIVDRIIPGEVVAECGSEWSPQPDWNFVYVSGTSAGVSVQVRRAGTAGELPAADVLEDWMTGTDAARARGICELSKGGLQSIETRRIPLFLKDGGSAPGLVQPAMLLEVRDPGDTWRGLCLGVEISADGVGASRVWQTLRVERHYVAGGA